MDETRFDELSRRLGGATTRRAGLKAAVGGLLGLAGLAGPAPGAGATKEAKRRRRRKRGEDGPPVGFGGRCNTDADCRVPGQACYFETFCACPPVDGVPQDPCSGVCCRDGERCVNGTCYPGCYGTCRRGCRLPLVNGTDYSGCDFSGQSFLVRDYPNGLRDISLDGADLRRTYLFDVALHNVTFRNAKLNNAFMWVSGSGAFVTGTTVFDGATLDGIWMNLLLARDGGDAPSISFERITARKAVMEITLYPDSIDRSISFAGADLTRTDLGHSDLREADFTDTILVYTDLEHTALEGAILRPAKAKCVIFSPSDYDCGNG